MKKTISLLLALVLCLSLCACGKSDAVIAVEEAISNIGEVSIESSEAISHAQKLYDILTEDEKEKVENRLLLADAVEEYEKAVEEERERIRIENYSALKGIYSELKEAYEIVDRHGSDLYTAWQLGIHNKDKFQGSNLNGSMNYLDSNLFLEYDDLLDGAAYALIVNIYGSDWNEKTEEVKQKNRDAVATGTLFFMASKNIPAACVCTVSGAYLLNGSVECINKALDNYSLVKADLSASDDFTTEIEHLDQLHIAIKSYLDYCQNPTGSFNSASDTINGYRNTVRDCISSLDSYFAA